MGVGKYSFGLLFIINMFRSKKKKGGRCEGYEGGGRDWPSDYDKGSWGVAEPNIDQKAGIFIACHKKRVSDHHLQL
ncbi:hypothetical protein RJT34_19211 [Clitoria ternatea]|uniref:Uncharacterized protein n=1 Tax=Clitoria ternatea TaxID=43366 RepID=A0AAN9P3C0_CLITE